MISRTDRGPLAEWWWSVDRIILALSFLLLGAGIWLSFAASPAVAIKIGRIHTYAFVERHIIFAAMAMLVMVSLSFLNMPALRRFSMVLLVVTILLLIAVLLEGEVIKGSARWIQFFGFSLQPSEFMKPAFVVVCAWLCALKLRDQKHPWMLLTFFLYIFCVTLLVLEPDIGQSFLLSLSWGALWFMSGASLLLLAGFLLSLLGFGTAAYFFSYHVHARVKEFLTGAGDTFQVDMGREAILHGGWWGCGPGEGTIKRLIPDSHTDFILSVAAEEYGIIFCILIVLCFFALFCRLITIALKERELFKRFAIAGLAVLLSLQAMINIAVNLHLMPAKGMTLPFISYGGSSMLSVAIAMGLLLALTKNRVRVSFVSPETPHRRRYGGG